EATRRHRSIGRPIIRAIARAHSDTGRLVQPLRHPSGGPARREAKHSRPTPDGRGGLEMKRALYVLGLASMLASPASAALVSLPSNGAQVNDDPANGIDPNQDAGLVDVAGGTVVAGNVQIPWATFEQKTGR